MIHIPRVFSASLNPKEEFSPFFEGWNKFLGVEKGKLPSRYILAAFQEA